MNKQTNLHFNTMIALFLAIFTQLLPIEVVAKPAQGTLIKGNGETIDARKKVLTPDDGWIYEELRYTPYIEEKDTKADIEITCSQYGFVSHNQDFDFLKIRCSKAIFPIGKITPPNKNGLFGDEYVYYIYLYNAEILYSFYGMEPHHISKYLALPNPIFELFLDCSWRSKQKEQKDKAVENYEYLQDSLASIKYHAKKTRMIGFIPNGDNTWDICFAVTGPMELERNVYLKTGYNSRYSHSPAVRMFREEHWKPEEHWKKELYKEKIVDGMVGKYSLYLGILKRYNRVKKSDIEDWEKNIISWDSMLNACNLYNYMNEFPVNLNRIYFDLLDTRSSKYSGIDIDYVFVLNQALNTKLPNRVKTPDIQEVSYPSIPPYIKMDGSNKFKIEKADYKIEDLRKLIPRLKCDHKNFLEKEDYDYLERFEHMLLIYDRNGWKYLPENCYWQLYEEFGNQKTR